MVFVHESGHLIAAAWAGATPKRMVLGSGHEIYRTELRGIKIILNSIPLGGYAAAVFGEVPHLRWRNAFYIFGGPLSNLITMAILYFLFGFDSSFFEGSNGFSPASAMILANSVGVLNLIPFTGKTHGIPVSSDGMLLIKLLFASREAVKSDLDKLKYHHDYFEGIDYYESKNYEEARKVYESLLRVIPDDFASQSTLALVELKCLQFDRALQHFKNLEVKVNTKEFEGYRGLIYNNIAFTHLLRNELEEATQYADVAMKISKDQSYVRGTYAAIQIEIGNVDTGISWMMNEVDMSHPNDHTILASAYLALGYHLKGDYKSRDKHLKFVRDHQDMLDNDIRFLFKRNLERMELEKRV